MNQFLKESANEYYELRKIFIKRLLPLEGAGGEEIHDSSPSEDAH